uniref:Isoform 2 of Early nodulin-40-1 n=1 Tax=Medicago truncatula TaxID=3880 RepID=P0DO61-2
MANRQVTKRQWIPFWSLNGYVSITLSM